MSLGAGAAESEPGTRTKRFLKWSALTWDLLTYALGLDECVRGGAKGEQLSLRDEVADNHRSLSGGCTRYVAVRFFIARGGVVGERHFLKDPRELIARLNDPC